MYSTTTRYFFLLLNFGIGHMLSAQISYDGTECIGKEFQVIAHVAVDSAMREPIYTQEEIDIALTATSGYFDRLCFSFMQCEYHVLENDYTLGIIRSQPISVEVRLRELRNRFSMRRRINVFFLESIEDVECGEGTYEGINTLRDANVFVEKDCEEGLSQQIAHQLGHVFGLLDTHHPEEIELVDGSNCTTVADKLCSTPADPFGQSYISERDSMRLMDTMLVVDFLKGCEFVYELRDPNDEFYDPKVFNIMSAYPCKCAFTSEQIEIMARNYRLSPIKHF